MAKPLISLLLLLLITYIAPENMVRGETIIGPGDSALLGNLNYACSQVDCQVLRKGCPCSFPDNLLNHAPIAMNLYYQAKGRNHWNCDFRASALVVITDPSYGNCIYA